VAGGYTEALKFPKDIESKGDRKLGRDYYS